MGSIVFKKITALMVIVTLSGCATAAKNINATYVSPEKYQNYDCEQLDQAITSVEDNVEELSSSRDSTLIKEAVAMLICPMVLWPALYLVMDVGKSDDLAQLKGEHEALASCAIEKQCTTIIARLDAGKNRLDASTQRVDQQRARLNVPREDNES